MWGAETVRAYEFLLRLNFAWVAEPVRGRRVRLVGAKHWSELDRVRVEDERALDDSESALATNGAVESPDARKTMRAWVWEARRPGQVGRVNGFSEDTLGVIVLVHGMAPSGMDDDRLLSVARALASLGYAAVVPNYDGLQACRINIDALNDIAWSIVAVSRAWHNRPVALFSACVAAGLTLCAAFRYGPVVRDCIAGVMCIGAYANVANVVQSNMVEECTENYGRNAMMYNFLEYGLPRCTHQPEDDAARCDGGWSDALAQALRIALEDSHYLRCGTAQEELPEYFAQLRRRAARQSDVVDTSRLPPSCAERVYWRLQTDGRYRRALAATIMAHLEVQRVIQACQPLDAMADSPVDLFIALVHGERDDIVPSSESRVLYRGILRRPHCLVKPALEITTLLNHGDRTPLRMSDVSRVVRLANVFREYFNHACNQGGQTEKADRGAYQEASPPPHPIAKPPRAWQLDTGTAMPASQLWTRLSQCWRAAA